jgi:phenylalanyl-tRNA synthetase beta chain
MYLQASEKLPYEHPARTAEIKWQGMFVGMLFELHPAVAKGHIEGRAAILDLDLDRMLELRPAQAKYKPVRRFPSSAFDLSVIAGLRDPAVEIKNLLELFAGPLLESIEYLRQYSGAPLAEGTRSITFRLTVGANDHTLSSEEVTGIRNVIIEEMQRFHYELRV